ncbi:hypothetical protein ACFL1H_02345, partial [Nanoarchaeota archaeon]
TSKRFLELYPESEYSGKVKQELIFNDLSLFAENVNSHENYDIVYKQLVDLNETLKTYKDQNIVIPEEIKLGFDEKSIREYLLSANFSKKAIITISDTIKVKKGINNLNSNGQCCLWDSNYFSDRSNNFPEGSIGHVIGMKGKNRIIKFSNGVVHWNDKWKVIRDYFEKNGKNVGAFKLNELLTNEPLNEFEIEKFIKETQILNGHLQ